ncbi:SRPBCC domain-containing protein [Sphingobacterium wenxiniae]|nr:SRPBCC domain-containing protein [Sphingobacterium wenxiniae]
MKKVHIAFETIIEASVEQVWTVLSDFDCYPEWSPTVKRFSEQPQVGQSVKVRLEQPGGMGITMKPKILKLEPLSEIRWRGILGIKGLFDGEHYFLLEPLGKGQTRFIQGEYFSGLLVPFFRNMIEGNTSKGFKLFNNALKERAEAYK